VAALLCTACAGPQIRTEQGFLLELDTEDLRAIPEADLRAKIASDATTLRQVVAGLDRLEEASAVLKADLDKRWGRFSQEENERIRRLLLSYLNYRTALFRMLAYHSAYRSASSEELSLKSFLVGYTAGLTLFAKAIGLSKLVEDSPPAQRKLNEPEPVWGIPGGIYDTIFDNVTHLGNVRLLSSSRDWLEEHRETAGRLGIWQDEAFSWLPARHRRQWAVIEAAAPGFLAASWTKAVRQSRASAYTLVYQVQAWFANLAGDTKVWFAPPRIPVAAVRALKGELRPGDVLIARKNYYVSNGFLPGFWPHAVLYVGTAEELERRGVAAHPDVARHQAAIRRAALDGNEHRAIEAVSEGVLFSSLEQVLHADYGAVLRPRVSEERKSRAIERAFSHLGKPYDFTFDFFSTDELVCTELVYRAYDEPIDGERLDLEMVEMLGRHTYPAVEFARKFKAEWAEDQDREAADLPPVRELDFVAYLDGPHWRSLEEFAATARRPSVPERRGWTVGVGGGLAMAAPAWSAFGGEQGTWLGARLGHSLDWRVLLEYGLDVWIPRASSRRAWSFTHAARLQWHPSKRFLFEGGLGVNHEEHRWAPAAVAGLGVELLSGHSWALDARVRYTVQVDPDGWSPGSTAGAAVGLQLY